MPTIIAANAELLSLWGQLIAAVQSVAESGGTPTLPWEVTGKFRIKEDGTFQLYNPDSEMYHTISLSGADGSVTMDFGAGEA